MSSRGCAATKLARRQTTSAENTIKKRGRNIALVVSWWVVEEEFSRFSGETPDRMDVGPQSLAEVSVVKICRERREAFRSPG